MSLRWTILGTGAISNKVIDGIKRSDGSCVHSIAGRNPDRLSGFQHEHKIDNALTDFDAAINDPVVDAVYVGLPSHVHHTMTIAAANAGKAVLSEKSLTTTMDEADELLQAITCQKTFFVEGFMYLAHPILRRYLDLLGDGRLGELRSINATYAADIWKFVNANGKGTLYNLGCYPVSLAHLTVQAMCGDGMFSKRQLQGFGTLNADGVICDAACAVRFDNGVLATLQSTDSYGTANFFSVTGTKGELRFVTNPWQPVAGRGHIQWRPFDGKTTDIFVDDDFDAFYHQIKMVERHVAAGDCQAARPSPQHADSYEIMEFLTQWESSCRANF